MKKIIITGAAGFIGCNLSRMAIARGYKVIGFDSLTYAGSALNLPEHKNFVFHRADIRDSDAALDVLDYHRPDAVINLAAESHVDRSIKDPLIFVETNVLGTANLLRRASTYAMGKEYFRFLQVSTDEVFGSLGETGKFCETSPLDPRSPYSASKAAADHLVSAWHHTYGLPTITTHCSNNYGPHQFPEKLIPRAIHCALKGLPIPVYGDGLNVRDWIHVEDHCSGILLALEKGTPGRSYCFGGNTELRNIDLINRICHILDKARPKKNGTSYKSQITFVEDRQGHDRRYAIDDTRAVVELGWCQLRSISGGLESTVDWYLSGDDECAE